MRSQEQQDSVRKAAAASATARKLAAERRAERRARLALPVQRHESSDGWTHIYRAKSGDACPICESA